MTNYIEPGVVSPAFLEGSKAQAPVKRSGLSFRSHTVQGWIKVEGNAGVMGLLATPGLTSSNMWMTQAITVPCGAGYQIQVEVGRAPNSNGVDPALKIHRLRTVLPLGQWVHLSYVADVSGNVLSLYLNGVLQPVDVVNGKDGNLSGLALENAVLTLGRDRENNIPLKGQVDEVRVWGRALTSAEIAANWNRAVVSGENGLLTDWPFNRPPALVAPQGDLIQRASSKGLALTSTLAVRGVATDGRHLYVNDSGVSIDLYTMEGAFVSSQAVANLPVNQNQMTWCGGFLFVRNFDRLYRVSTIDWSSVPVSVPAERPLLTGRGWMVGDLFAMPDGRLGLCGAKDANGRMTVRFYGVSADGRALNWSEDRTIVDASAFPNDFHGAASDGTCLYLIEFGSQAYKSYHLGTGAVAYDGTGVNLRLPAQGAQLSNVTYLTRDPLTGAFIAGDYNGPRLLRSAPSAGLVQLDGATEDTPFVVTFGMLFAAMRVVDDGPAASLNFRIEAVPNGTLSKNGSPVSAGALVGVEDKLVWTPPAQANGVLAAFAVKAWDGQQASLQTINVNVQVAAVNDAPALTGPAATLVDGVEDTRYTIRQADLLQGYSDVEGQALRVFGLSANLGTLVDNDNGTWTFTPPANFSGVVSLRYEVTDGAGSVAAQRTFTLTAVNDAPTLQGPQAELGAGSENVPLTLRQGDLLKGWSDADGDALRVRELKASVGQVVETGVGTWVFIPPANFSGPVTLSYQVSDDRGGSVGAGQNFVVKPLHDAVFTTQIQWGGDSAPWHDSGKVVLGSAEAVPTGFDLRTVDNGRTVVGRVKGNVAFRATRQPDTGVYQAEIQWGGPRAPWRPAGGFFFGGTALNQLKIQSGDGGRTFGGMLSSVGSGGVGFRATLAAETRPQSLDARYGTQIQWGGDSAPWHDNGVLVLGRGNLLLEALDLTTGDNGQTLTGTVCAVVPWRGTWQSVTSTYSAEIQCGGDQAPWYPAGTVAFGGPGSAPLNFLNVASADGGRTFGGVLCSIGSGGVGFKATRFTG